MATRFAKKRKRDALELLTKTAVPADQKHRACYQIRPNQGQIPRGLAIVS